MVMVQAPGDGEFAAPDDLKDIVSECLTADWRSSLNVWKAVREAREDAKESAVRRALRDLQSEGHVECRPGGGRGKPSFWRSKPEEL